VVRSNPLIAQGELDCRNGGILMFLGGLCETLSLYILIYIYIYERLNCVQFDFNYNFNRFQAINSSQGFKTYLVFQIRLRQTYCLEV
jgi:hypothetical protein